MPDLGIYGVEVLSTYAITVLLLLVLAALTWTRARRVRKDLDAAEKRRGNG